MPDQTNSQDIFQPGKRSWVNKFASAFCGVRQGIAGQSSFVVHLVATVAVLALAAMLQVSLERWCLLLLCIGSVMAAELFNTSLEWICRSVTNRIDPNIERALNIASGSVLVVAITSALVGSLILLDAIF